MRYRGIRAEITIRNNEFKILKVIKENRDIQHSRLIELLEKRNLMVKKTAEDALSRMTKEKRIHVIPVGNRKHYRLPEDYMASDIINERALVETIPQTIDTMIEEMEKKYKDLSLQNKASYSMTCMGIVLQAIHEIIMYNVKSESQKNRFSRIETEHKKRIKRIMDVINSESDRDILLPWIEYKVVGRPIATEEEFTTFANRIKNDEYWL